MVADLFGITADEALRLAYAVFAAIRHELPARSRIDRVAAALIEDLREVGERLE